MMGCLSFWKVFTSKSEKYDISTRIRKKTFIKKALSSRKNEDRCSF